MVLLDTSTGCWEPSMHKIRILALDFSGGKCIVLSLGKILARKETKIWSRKSDRESGTIWCKIWSINDFFEDMMLIRVKIFSISVSENLDWKWKVRNSCLLSPGNQFRRKSIPCWLCQLSVTVMSILAQTGEWSNSLCHCYIAPNLLQSSSES